MLLEPLRRKTRLLSVTLSAASPPSEEPITVPDAKAHIGIGDEVADEDFRIFNLITGARAFLELQTGRAVIRQTAKARFSGALLPHVLPYPPVVSITSVNSYYQGAATAETPSGFFVERPESPRPRLRMKSSGAWVGASIDEVEITYLVGYAAADIPEPLKQAVRILVREFFDNPVSYDVGTVVREIPNSVSAIIADYSVKF